MIMIIAPTERYTPPSGKLSCFRIERTSARKFFLSDDVKFDLSIALIAFNLVSKTFASVAAVLELIIVDDAEAVAASD